MAFDRSRTSFEMCDQAASRLWLVGLGVLWYGDTRLREVLLMNRGPKIHERFNRRMKDRALSRSLLDLHGIVHGMPSRRSTTVLAYPDQAADGKQFGRGCSPSPVLRISYASAVSTLSTRNMPGDGEDHCSKALHD